ncbi:RebB family R body protein [Dyella sp. LX-66]|nr:RebB family R body protein [Dyella sp. LX-1]MBT2141449.1 RebB family R body protein [Dyella sp. LX-66]
MSTTTEINSQITDSIAQTNPRPAANAVVLGNAAAVALGNLYQATASALSLAAYNAVNSQQQQNMLAQAATTQGVMQIYSIDTASAGEATQHPLEPSPVATAAAVHDVSAPVTQLSVSPNAHGIDNAEPWCHAALELMGTVASTLHAFQKVTEESGTAAIRQAATAAVLIHMIKSPDQLEQYQKILKVIEEL